MKRSPSPVGQWNLPSWMNTRLPSLQFSNSCARYRTVRIKIIGDTPLVMHKFAPYTVLHHYAIG